MNADLELLGQVSNVGDYSNYQSSQSFKELIDSYRTLIASTTKCNAMWSGSGLGSEVVRRMKKDVKDHLNASPEPEEAVREAISVMRSGCERIRGLSCGLVNETNRANNCIAYVNKKSSELLERSSEIGLGTGLEGASTGMTGEDFEKLLLEDTTQQAGIFGGINPSQILGWTLALGILSTGIYWMINPGARPDFSQLKR